MPDTATKQKNAVGNSAKAEKVCIFYDLNNRKAEKGFFPDGRTPKGSATHIIDKGHGTSANTMVTLTLKAGINTPILQKTWETAKEKDSSIKQRLKEKIYIEFPVVNPKAKPFIERFSIEDAKSILYLAEDLSQLKQWLQEVKTEKYRQLIESKISDPQVSIRDY